MQKSINKKWSGLLLVILTLYALHVASLFNHFFLSPILAPSENTTVKVYPGETIASVATRLFKANLISSPDLFEWIGLLTARRGGLRYGEYRVQYPMTQWQMLSHMKEGKGLVRHRFTIVNGWTFDNVLSAFSSDENVKQKISALGNQGLMQWLASTHLHAEGLFYPDTYFFTWGHSDLSILKTAYQKMQTVLNNAWQNRAPNLPYQNAYQALIVASLIERETSDYAEKPVIASVILNRLEKNMPLQIDPTVLYGLSKTFDGPLTKADLKRKTPYNTYLKLGLPPTPICMPSESSINAALHPAQTDYLYYVATGHGGHNFSVTYADHQQQVAAYRASLAKDVDASK